jgi:Na+/H+ antiporter NhaA
MSDPQTGGAAGRSGAPQAGTSFLGHTAWARNLQTPLRRFLRTETGGAAFLLAATLAALVWANVDATSYESFWRTRLSVVIGGWGVSQDLRHWVNTGLMTFFFFVVGLEARREFDMGELRERRRVMLPLLAGVAGMAASVALFAAINAGHGSLRGWGVVLSTDTAFALGVLALVGPRSSERLRAFILTIVVVDDLLSLAVIAIVYSAHVVVPALLVALAIGGAILAARAAGVRFGPVYVALGAAAWVALFKSGVDPIIIGLAMGLLTVAYPAGRGDLQHATSLFRRFREQPTPELERSARGALRSAISSNERWQQLYHPWASYVVVPLFALANAGIAVGGGDLARAFRSPITLGIVAGYVIGKPLGVVAASWLSARLSGGRLRPPVGWVAVAGGGASAGLGFTVSLLIADLAFRGPALADAKVGVLTAALGASLLTWSIFRVTALLPRRARFRALLGTVEAIEDLAVPVDSRRDRVRGSAGALVTLVEYGDFECPFCGLAEPAIRELLSEFSDVRYVWRHLPLNDVHPLAQVAAEAVEAAAAQGAFWEMHDVLLDHRGDVTETDLYRHADELRLDGERFADDIRRRAGDARIAEDVDSADLSGVAGTPTFFINGRRHSGPYDVTTLAKAVKAAGARAIAAA